MRDSFSLGTMNGLPQNPIQQHDSRENAFAELADAGACDIPRAETVDSARDGTSWAGVLQAGGAWSLTKQSAESFVCRIAPDEKDTSHNETAGA